MLRLAEEWGYIDRVPRIRPEREDQGRLRFLTEAEAARLLTECRRSAEHPVSSCRRPQLAAIVTVALNTGMRAVYDVLAPLRGDRTSGRVCGGDPSACAAPP